LVELTFLRQYCRTRTARDRVSRSDRPHYCPYALGIDLWPWPMTLTFNPRRAMVMTRT